MHPPRGQECTPGARTDIFYWGIVQFRGFGEVFCTVSTLTTKKRWLGCEARI